MREGMSICSVRADGSITGKDTWKRRKVVINNAPKTRGSYVNAYPSQNRNGWEPGH
jgi:hypothetical protein